MRVFRNQPALTTEERLREVMRELREKDVQLVRLRAECDSLRGQLEKDPSLMWWVQSKASRQGKALNVLNRRVVSQRFVLRTLEQLGRGLTKDEYKAAREAVANEQLRERIDSEPTAV